MGADGLSESTESKFLDASRSTYDRVLNRISTRAAQVGVIGLGYVGLPLAVAIARAGFPVSGFDIEAQKVGSLTTAILYRGGDVDSPCRPGGERTVPRHCGFCRTGRLRCRHHLRSDTADEKP
ncbi:hypothetical protein MES4922_140020 [Mesorhizobium ventifaucium]|uniref:UDP-glucose/GDP-mannose dehydrogenase N-terminal domain-containing protein n=1 Tax=Mesorhizobium ventifaucium TaxID=666020 RepID=A0ABM9DHV5_9HYPH|nr:hypothetical protein MES4922_140020 [Mesorhizobium ventifaucium]